MRSNQYRKAISAKPSSVQRTRGIKAPAKGILIVTEGAVTERVYFEEIKKRYALPTVELHIVGLGIGDPATLAQAALRLQKSRRVAAKNEEISYAQVADFDEIWIVFDTDLPWQQGKLKAGLEFASSKKIHCAYSTPCFEYWLLLHLERTTSLMTKCADVIAKLSQSTGLTYSKNEPQAKATISPLIAHLAKAEENAVWVRRYHEQAGTAFPCYPSTEVDRLIASILEALPPAQRS
jgi:RloB-like protein